MKRTKITEGMVKKFEDLYYNHNKTTTYIADAFGVNRATVSNHLKVKRKKGPRKVLSEDQIRRMVRLYNEGYSIRELRDHFSISFGTVRNYLIEEKVELRPANRPKGKKSFNTLASEPKEAKPDRSYFTKQQRHTMVKLFTTQGYSIPRLARYFGTTPRTIREALIKEGVQPPTKK